MKNPIVRILVLILSLGIATGYVWFSSNKNRGDDQTEIKGAPTKSSERTSHEEEKVVVSDQEVEQMRNNLMRSSKSGLIMSDVDIRKMLEERKKAAQGKGGKTEQDPLNILPSTKNPARLISPSDIDQLLEPKLVPPSEEEKQVEK